MDFFQRLGNWFGGKGWVSDEERRRKEQQQAAPQPQPQPQTPAVQRHPRMAGSQPQGPSRALADRQHVLRSRENQRNNLIARANAELNTAIDDKTGYWKEDADKLREEVRKGGSTEHIQGLLQSVQNRRKEIGEQRAEEQRMRQRIAANPNERRSQQQIDESINNWRDTDILVRSKGTFNAQENREKLQLRDVRLGAADNNQTVGGIIDDIKGSSGIDQQKKFEALDSKIKDLREAFTDEDVYRRDLLIHTRNEAEKHRRNDLGSIARGVVKGMTVDTLSGAGDGVAMAIHAADGSRERLAKSKQVTADYYNRELQKAIQNGDERARVYYSQELNRENREISRILGRQVEESDPIKNAGRIANAAALPVSFAAQSTGAGVAVKAGVTGSGATRAATTSIGKLVESYSPQLTGRLAQTATGKVLNSTPAQLVSRVLPKASPRLQAVAAESMANVLSGVPQGVASTAAEAGSRGRLEDYLINSATGAVMDAAFPVAAYGAGRGVHYMGKGAKYLSGRVQALDSTLRTQALQRSLASESMRPVNTRITNLMDYEGAPDRARVEEYKQAIKNGQDVGPLLVMRDGVGKWGVEDGKHRLQAYKELGMKRVPVLPIDKEKLSRVLPEYETQQLPVSGHAEHPAAASTPYASAGSTGIAPADTTTYSPRGNIRPDAQFSDASDAATLHPAQTPYELDSPSTYTAGHADQDSAGISSYDTSVARNGDVAGSGVRYKHTREDVDDFIYLYSNKHASTPQHDRLGPRQLRTLWEVLDGTNSDKLRIADEIHPRAFWEYRRDSSGNETRIPRTAEEYRRLADEAVAYRNSPEYARRLEEERLKEERYQKELKEYARANEQHELHVSKLAAELGITKEAVAKLDAAERYRERNTLNDRAMSQSYNRMRNGGYNAEYMVSNRAIDAMRNGRFPAEEAAKRLGLKPETIERFLPTSEWHHVGEDATPTDFYDINDLIDASNNMLGDMADSADPSVLLLKKMLAHEEGMRYRQQSSGRPNAAEATSGYTLETGQLQSTNPDDIVANPPRIVNDKRFKVNADIAELQSTINEMQENPKPRMTRVLRQAIDDEIYLSHPQLFNEEITNIQGNNGDWGIPRIHVDDLRHYLGDLTEDIPVTYRRTSGKRDIDVIAQEMGYSEVDEFLNELQRAAEARRTVRENKQLLAELRRNPEIITKAQEKLAKQEQAAAAEMAAKRQQAAVEIEDLLRERRKYAEEADTDSVAQIDETVELLAKEGGLKPSEIDVIRRDIEASNRRENLDAEYAPKEKTSTAEELRPAGDAKFGNLNGDHIITGGNLHKQTKVGVDDITDRPVQDGEWEYRQHKKRRYNEKTKKWESFQQFERRFIGEGSDGKWKPYSKAAYTWYKDPNIAKLSQDEKIKVATEMARKEGNVYDFMAVRQPRHDKRGYVIGEETVVKPIEDYGRVTIDGGLVRDVKTGDVLGSHVQVTPFGAVYQIEGKMAILEEDAFRTMKNKSGVFDTFARASEKNAGENAEMFHNLIDEGRNAQANAKVEQVEVKTIAAKAADDALQYKPRKMSTNGFFRALGEYIENKVPMAGEINGELVAFKTKEEAFEHWYGKDALEGARRYDETMRSLYDRLINEANEVRRRLGQKEIEYRKDYMAHIWDDDGVITEWLRDGVSTFGIHGDFAAAGRGKIPAWIAGRSDMTKPMKRFNQHELSRKGAEGYILDPRVAFERASDAMILNTHLEPVIAKGRSMAAAISALDTFDREMMGTKKEFARYVSEDLENGGLQPIKNVASDQRVAITDFVNALAGKSSRFDREMLNSMPKTMRFIRHAEAVNGANKIMGNLSSVLAQALNLEGTVRENGFKNAGWAIAHVNSRAMKNTQSRSPFLTERYTNSTGRFEKSKWQSTREFVSKYTAMDITENTFVRINWTANYARLKKQGLRGRELILQTDRATARAVGDRSIGAMPPAYQSAIGKMFLQFTYEVNEKWKNDLSHIGGIARSLKGRDLKKATRMSVTGAEALATGMAMNWLYKEVTGHAPLPDPVGAIIDVVANAQKDDEDESKRNPLLYGITSSVSQFAKANPAAAAVVNTIPKRYREDIFGKDSDFGRFDGATGVAQTGANFIGAGHYALEGKWDKVGKSVLGVVPMGSQIKKTLSGYDTMSDGTVRTESGKVVGAVDKNDPLKWAQALAFGKNALKETQDGYKRTTGFLTDDQTKTYDEIRQKFGEDSAKTYLDDVHRARTVKGELKKAGIDAKSDGGSKSAELAQAEASIKMRSGEWREENGLMVDKQGNVQRAYHKALAQTQGESDEAYANWMKAYDIDNAGSKPRRSSGNAMLDRLQAEKDKTNSAETAVRLVTDTEKYRDLPQWVKDRYYEKAGLKPHEIEYAALASYGPNEKLHAYWLPRTKEMGHEQLLQELTNGRRESIAGDILAPNGVVDNLALRGLISKEEAKALKRSKFAHDGTPKATGRSGGGGRAGGRGRRTNTSNQESINAIMSAYKQSMQMSKSIGQHATARRAAPDAGKLQMRQTVLRRRGASSRARIPRQARRVRKN